jgi:ABC-type polysaccharide/polyol phosphate export permease
MFNNFLIKSIKFPIESLVVQVILQNLFSHFFEFLLLLAGLVWFGSSIMFLPLYFVILIFFCFFIFGLSLILASLSVYIIDLVNIWTYAVRIIWIFLPIFYAIGGQTRLFYINLLNPVYYFITVARDIIVYNKIPEMWITTGAVLYALIFFIVGVIVFNKLKSRIAELI